MGLGRIKKSEQEYRDIINRNLRKDLMQYLQRARIKLHGPDGGVIISIPVIEIPVLHFSNPKPYEDMGDDEFGVNVGVGQGEGDPGTDLGAAHGDNGGQGKNGQRSAGTGRGEEFELLMPLDEFADILFDAILKLPRIKPKGDKTIKSETDKYSSVSRIGPESLIHKRRTWKEALKRSIAEGSFDPKKPRLIPIRNDKRYRQSKTVLKKQYNAVMIYIKDVSGSVMEEDRKVIDSFCQFTELQLLRYYGSLEREWIIHDGEASVVSREEFFRTTRAGGTVASSGHKEALKLIKEKYPPEKWNIYIFYFSDGFNWGEGDDEICMEIIEKDFLPSVNQYAYLEIDSSRLWAMSNPKAVEKKFSPAGNFGLMLRSYFHDNPLVRMTNLRTADDIPGAIQAVFSEGN